jgi:hypothetical protein
MLLVKNKKEEKATVTVTPLPVLLFVVVAVVVIVASSTNWGLLLAVDGAVYCACPVINIRVCGEQE